MTKTSASLQSYPSPVASVYGALSDHPAANAAYQALSQAGGQTYAVGGAVRDAFLGEDPKDVDLMVAGLPPEQVESVLSALPGRVDLTGQHFGVYRYRSVNGDEVEVALPRTDHSTGVDHTDFDVQVDHNLPVEQDLSRRDFTANAMALNLATGQLHDPFNGQKDIEDKTLRVISPQSFADDPLRTVRALVAHARHGLKPDPETLNQMKAHASSVRHLPQERIQMELDKLFNTKNPRKAIELAEQTGVLQYVLPEVAATMGFDQANPHHELDLGTHMMNVLEHTSKKNDDKDVRLAALLHDIGKPDSQWFSDDGIAHYYYDPRISGSADHARVGADQAREAMRRLKYPNDRIDRVHKLVKLHMFPDFSSAKGARKFLHKAGDLQTAMDLLDLREADRAGKQSKKKKSNRPWDTSPDTGHHSDGFYYYLPEENRNLCLACGDALQSRHPDVEMETHQTLNSTDPYCSSCQDLLLPLEGEKGQQRLVSKTAAVDTDLMRKLVEEAVRQKAPIQIRDLAINGNDLVAMGMKGPEIGQVLRALNELVLDQPEMNSRAALLSAVPYLYQSL